MKIEKVVFVDDYGRVVEYDPGSHRDQLHKFLVVVVFGRDPWVVAGTEKYRHHSDLGAAYAAPGMSHPADRLINGKIVDGTWASARVIGAGLVRHVDGHSSVDPAWESKDFRVVTPEALRRTILDALGLKS